MSQLQVEHLRCYQCLGKDRQPNFFCLTLGSCLALPSTVLLMSTQFLSCQNWGTVYKCVANLILTTKMTLARSPRKVVLVVYTLCVYVFVSVVACRRTQLCLEQQRIIHEISKKHKKNDKLFRVSAIVLFTSHWWNLDHAARHIVSISVCSNNFHSVSTYQTLETSCLQDV